MSQRGKGGKHVTQVTGDGNRLNINSIDINVLSNFGELLISLCRRLKGFLQKDKAIGELQKEIVTKEAEIAQLRGEIRERIDKLFEAQQQIVNASQVIERAFQELSSSTKVDNTTYLILRQIRDDFIKLREQEKSIKACTFAGLWVDERTEMWIQEAMYEVIRRQPGYSTKNQDLLYQDLHAYLNWLRDSLVIYAQPWRTKLQELNQNRSIRSPLLYREIFEYIQARGDFSSLHDDEVYWLLSMVRELIDNL